MDLLRIPSISTLPEHKPDMQRAIEFLANELREMGMKNVEIIAGKESQHPLLYAEWLEAPGKPTLLLYGHYDVQPPKSARGMGVAALRTHNPQGEHLCPRGYGAQPCEAYSVAAAFHLAASSKKGFSAHTASPRIQLPVQHHLVPASPRHGSNAPWRPRHDFIHESQGKVPAPGSPHSRTPRRR